MLRPGPATLSYSTKRTTALTAVTRFIRAHKTLSATSIAIIALLTIWTASPVLRGSVTARIDVARGHYEIETFGLPVPWRPQYAQLLHDRYGVEINPVAGCVVSQSLLSYSHAYNSVVADAVRHKFAHDIFAECAADARKAYEQQAAAQANRAE